MKEIYMSNHLKDTVAKHNRMIGLIGLGAAAAAAAGALLADPVTGIVPIMAGAAMANNHLKKKSIFEKNNKRS